MSFFPTLTDNDLDRLCDYSHLFVHLQVDFSSMIPSNYTVHGIARFLASCTRLVTLHVVGGRDETFFQVTQACRSCPLTSLRLRQCKVGLLPSTSDALSFLGLTSLDVTDCAFPPSFYAAFGRLINLESLFVHNCVGVGDGCVAGLVEGGVKLKGLSISSKWETTGAGYRAIIGAPISQSLEWLLVRKGSPQTDSDIAHVVASCPRLQELDAFDFTDEDIATICEGRPVQQLALVGFHRSPEVTSAGVTQLAETYTATLKCIQLFGCGWSAEQFESLRSDFRLRFPRILLRVEGSSLLA